MANPPSNQERARASFAQDDSTDIAPTEASNSADSFPLDVEAARKRRINNDLVTLFRNSCPTNTTASIQGIGLYTHASFPTLSEEATAQEFPPPKFLPIGGPDRILKDQSVPEAPISEDVQELWKQVQAVVNEEENCVGESDQSIEQLRERYGALNVPDANEDTTSLAQQQLQWQQYLEALHKLQNQKISGNVVMAGFDNEGGGSTSAMASLHPTTKANLYQESRDPRKRL
jgi:hypothetical protein